METATNRPLRHSMTRQKYRDSTTVLVISPLHRDIKARSEAEGQTVIEVANQALAVGLGRFDLLPETHPLYKPASA